MVIRPLPRHLHPGAWWLWALGLAAAASRTTNPVLLLLLGAAAGYVVAARRSAAPWARAYVVFLRIGAVVIVIRVVLFALFGQAVPGHVLLDLPQLTLPDWAVGVRVGGPVTAEGVYLALTDGLRLAVMLGCVGAANALASPYRLLRCLPGALYEAGVAVVVAMSFAPQAITSVSRVRAAQRLRGRPYRGVRGLRAMAVPVLEGALERSLELAASMDARGYGRRGPSSAAARRLTAGLSLAGLVGLCAGTYGLLDAGSPHWLGVPLLVAGTTLAVLSLAAGSRRATRSRYRPDRWLLPEWLVAASGIGCAVAYVLAAADPAMHPQVVPLAEPGLPLLPALLSIVAMLPAWVAPPPPEPAPPRAAAARTRTTAEVLAR